MSRKPFHVTCVIEVCSSLNSSFHFHTQNAAAESDVRERNDHQTEPFPLEPNSQTNRPPLSRSSGDDGAAADTAALRWSRVPFCCERQLHEPTGKKDGVLSAFVGRGSRCGESLSRHLFDSISARVTSADYVSGKQAAT